MDTVLYTISVVLSGLGFYLSMDRLFTHLQRPAVQVIITEGERSEEVECPEYVEVKQEEMEDE